MQIYILPTPSNRTNFIVHIISGTDYSFFLKWMLLLTIPYTAYNEIKKTMIARFKSMLQDLFQLKLGTL